MSLLARLRPHANVALDVVGLGAISTGIGMVETPAGVIAAGIACLLVSWRVTK